MLDDSITEAAHELWNYHNIDLTPTAPVDFILALGSHDPRVAEEAAHAWLANLAPWLITSGGSGKVTTGLWSKPEALVFRDIAVERGVDPDRILVETQATNTGENITLSREVMLAHGVPTNSGIMVTKPYMKRRALATAQKQWPEVDWFVSAPDTTMDDYPTNDVPLERMLNLMVGDLQRMDVYAEKGFQVPQEIPDTVWAAWRTLVKAGYDQFVLR